MYYRVVSLIHVHGVTVYHLSQLLFNTLLLNLSSLTNNKRWPAMIGMSVEMMFNNLHGHIHQILVDQVDVITPKPPQVLTQSTFSHMMMPNQSKQRLNGPLIMD